MKVPTISNIEEFRTYVLQCYPLEACGFIIADKFVPVPNIHDTPEDDFKISDKDYLKALQSKKLVAVVHSHPTILGKTLVDSAGNYYDRRTPSMVDMVSQEAMALPWGIVTTEGQTVSELLWFGLDEPADLIGRPYISNVYDCYNLIRDYYRTKMGITLGMHPRPKNWEEWNPRLYDDNWEKEGFVKVDWKDTEPQIGDLIYMHLANRKWVDHAGVYVGDGKFLHHMYNQLSYEDSLHARKWDKHIAYCLRHSTKFKN